MFLDVEEIASGIISIIKTPINLTAYMWHFLTEPLFTIDLTFLNSGVAQWLIDLLTSIDFTFGVYDINLLFIMTTAGVTLFLLLKIINLIPLV